MSTTTEDTFGAKVEEYRERLGMLQKELAERSGLSRSHLNRIEKGTRKRPQVETVLRMIEALRLTPGEAEKLVRLAGLSPLVLQENNFKKEKGVKGAARSKSAGGKVKVNQRSSAPSTRLNAPLSISHREILMQRIAVLENVLLNAHEEIREIGALVARMQEE